MRHDNIVLAATDACWLPVQVFCLSGFKFNGTYPSDCQKKAACTYAPQISGNYADAGNLSKRPGHYRFTVLSHSLTGHSFPLQEDQES